MEIRFTCQGHPNIKASHKTTLEFTKHDYVSPRGNCIIGIKADFKLQELKRFLKTLKKGERVRVEIKAGDVKESVVASPNLGYSDQQEIVIRTTDFLSKRTFATKATKASAGLSEEMRAALRTSSLTITISKHL